MGNVQDYDRLFQTCTWAVTAPSSPSSAAETVNIAAPCDHTVYDVITYYHTGADLV